MKAMRLMELIGEVDDRFIEESFGKPTVRRRKQYWTLAMAAVLALALIGGGAAYLRWGGNTWRAGSAAPADSAPAEAAAEDAVPAEGAWKGAEAPAAAEAPMPAPATGEAAEEAAPAEETVEAPAEAEADMDYGQDALEDRITSMTLGDLSLGMPESEVRALLGDPVEITEPGGADEIGVTRTGWMYKLGENPEVLYDLTVTLGDDGGGYRNVVDRITAGRGSGLSLDGGLSVGDSEDRIGDLDLPFAVSDDVEYVADENGGERENHLATYTLTAGGRFLSITAEEGVVTWIELGGWFPEFDLDPWAETALPYDLSGDPLTIYFLEGQNWQAETRTGREAKYLCTLLNIEELRAGTPGEPVCVIDFGNGTLAELYGPGDGGAIYTCPQGVSFTPDLLEDLRYQRELSVYDYVIFPEGTWEEVNREE